MSRRLKLINAVAYVCKKVLKIFGKKNENLISAVLADQLMPDIPVATSVGEIKFSCLGWIPVWRAQTLLSKEPETIAWIDSFADEDVLWDIGANVGGFSLYAARRGINVLAFEPSPGNYFLLNKDINVNGLSDKVKGLCIAFSEKTQLDVLYMSSLEMGAAHCTFSEKKNDHGEEMSVLFEQGAIGYAIDDFVAQFNPPFPNHIKIDVDGIEKEIILGAGKVLRDSRVKSILVELDPTRLDYCDEMVHHIESLGFKGRLIHESGAGANAIFHR